MWVLGGGLVPHPPIMVPEVGGEEAYRVRRTQEALKALGRRLSEKGAEAAVLITPHGPVLWEAVPLVLQPRLEGDLGRFGAPEVSFSLTTDEELARALVEAAGVLEVPVSLVRSGYRLDHGITAPLYWLEKGGFDLPVVLCSMAFLSWRRLYRFGVAVRRAAERCRRRVVVVASGDLSHRLSPEAPYGYDPAGPQFDARIREIVAAADAKALLSLNPAWAERAGECGLRPLIMLFGAFDGYRLRTEILSYEGPFGVGYLVAYLEPGEEAPERCLAEELAGKPRRQESYLVQVARRAIEAYLNRGERLEVKDIPPEFARRAGVFVSLKKEGMLRGCIGTVGPTQPNIVEEVIENAISAATRDPRFEPVDPQEIEDLTISVDVLEEPEPVESLAELDPKEYGVIVVSGSRRGLLLPDIEGVDTPEQQLAIARRKAGIGPHEPVEIYRFRVTRYH
ncbi:AMMECR1 domain protein [Ammonifex degensii KC4]|uniref:AMMECR1 domain protein n=1 Tax=Ammonifex degensii (strain DSM 10501 / KC4) TaxID=429009 RepID=C9RAW2_AMMDK|nr:AmmeMemoRadiSam system protein A [Ammonifex degensii]ACX51389.1 AMMECR1 domain protein [Ammonifex degensii KC4]